LLEKTGASGTAQLIRFGLQASAGRPSFADLAITKANG
jgi:two-component system response regulator FixJ